MDTCKQSVLLFGTGSGGRNGYRYLRKTHEIIGFCDNNKAKQGHSFCGLPVYSPNALKDLHMDRIVICSMYKDEIRDQLTSKLNIPYEIIETLDPDVRVYGNGKPLGCMMILLPLLLAISYIAYRLLT